MQYLGLNNFRTVLFVKIKISGLIIDLGTSDMAHFLEKYLGQVFQALIRVEGPVEERYRSNNAEKQGARNSENHLRL